jgi:hypothetical protein
VGTAAAVVADHQAQHTILLARLDFRVRGVRVPGHVGDQLRRAEVRDRRDRLRWPDGQVDPRAHRQAGTAGQGLQRHVQPVVEGRRVDAANQVAQLGDRRPGVAQRGVHQVPATDQFRGVARGAGQLLLRAGERHRDGDEPGLRAVVEVALDPAQRRDGVLHGQRPRLLQDLHPLVEPPAAEQGARHRPDDEGEQPARGPGAERQHGQPDDGGEQRRGPAVHPDVVGQPDAAPAVLLDRLPPQRIGQSGEPVEPHADRHGQEHHTDGGVGDGERGRPPAVAVGERGTQRTHQPTPVLPPRRRWCDVLGEQPTQHRPVHAAGAAGEREHADEQDEPDLGEGRDEGHGEQGQHGDAAEEAGQRREQSVRGFPRTAKDFTHSDAPHPRSAAPATSLATAHTTPSTRDRPRTPASPPTPIPATRTAVCRSSSPAAP